MNYISQLNAFFELLPSNPLTPKAICLYSTLLHINNKCLWKSRFTVANTTLVMITGIDRRTLDRIRNELIQKKYIQYKKGTGNQSGEYFINQLYDTQKSLNVQNDTQSDTQNDMQMSHCVTSLDKQNINYYSNLLIKTREKFPAPRKANETMLAIAMAKKSDEWELLSVEEQNRFISEV